MGLSRRAFLTRVGQAGGFGAAFMSMQALGLMPMAGQEVPRIEAAAGSGNGLAVVILGGGIAGLVAAYELKALGYRCTVLEARERPGGRNWTVRGGDRVEFTDGSAQTCAFGPGMYQNAGAGRLPSTHKTMLGYCRKLGVALEVEVNTSRSALLESGRVNGGRAVVQRQAANDTRGHVSELLGKCVRTGALDAEMTKADAARVLEFLRNYGPLDASGRYLGSDRAGYATEPGAGDAGGTFATPLSMQTLLDGNFWDGLLYEEQHDWQATMMQPVGGMDRIAYAFARELGETMRYHSPVTEMTKTARGVRVGYTQAGVARTLEADFCICALPLTTLRKVKHDLAAPYKRVVDESEYSHSYKVAWESRRFWEQDYNIFGGLEFVAEGCSPVWLPSANLLSERGVLVSGYDEAWNTPFGRLSLPEKFAASRLSVEKLHPGHGKELEKPVYLGWGQIRWNEGSWLANYGPGQVYHEGSEAIQLGHAIDGKFANAGYTTLLEPDGPIYFAGDHVSYLVGWQEGAALSSLRVVQKIGERMKGRVATA